MLVVFGEFGNKLFNIPELKESTGRNQALAVMNALKERNLKTAVKGMCYDTTATKVGN